MYGTRTWPCPAATRFSAPHFAHLLSMRVLPCLMVIDLRSNASFTSRSVSSRIACFDISRFLALCTIGHIADRGPRQRACCVTIVHERVRNQPPSAAQPSPLSGRVRNGIVKRQRWRSTVALGTVKWFNSQKGYGFIQPQDGGVCPYLGCR